jgi:hypothetical protein
VKIATFNMRGGGSLKHWAAIKEEIAPDLLFVQETKDPANFPPDLLHPSVPPSALWHPVDHGRWGSAVLCDGASLEPITIPDFAGQVVGGLLNLAEPVYAFSVHMPQLKSSYVHVANMMLDRLAPLVDGLPLILAGDWNLSIGVRQPDEELQNEPGGLELIRRLEEDFGVRSAWSTMNPNLALPQTLRWSRDPLPPFHIDGIFIPTEWGDRLRSAEVLSGEPWTSLSDHNPVVADLARFQ